MFIKDIVFRAGDNNWRNQMAQILELLPQPLQTTSKIPIVSGLAAINRATRIPDHREISFSVKLVSHFA
jgi:hypothetical protein